jgi:hypothetical protein
MIKIVEITYIRKYFLTPLQILFYILQIRVTEIARNKYNFNKQFQAQLKTRYPHIFVIYTLILLYLCEVLIACRLHKCRFCISQFSETTSKFKLNTSLRKAQSSLRSAPKCITLRRNTKVDYVTSQNPKLNIRFTQSAYCYFLL